MRQALLETNFVTSKYYPEQLWAQKTINNWGGQSWYPWISTFPTSRLPPRWAILRWGILRVFLSSLLVFTIIIFSKQNSTVQFPPIKASWQSFHRLPWNFSHHLDSRARRLECGKAPFQILPVKGEPQCLLPPPFPSNATFRSEASNDLRIPFTFICGPFAETSPTFSGAPASARSNVIVAARTMNSSVSSCSYAK